MSFNSFAQPEPHTDSLTRSRLPALYSDFRPQKTLNPDGYVANVDAWKKGLAAAARAGCLPTKANESNKLVLQVDEDLLRALETKQWGRPLALGTVVRDAIEKNEMMPVQNFKAAKESIYRRGWGISPSSIVSWGLRQAGLTGGSGGEDEVPVGKLVILSNIENASKEVLRRMSEQVSRVDRIFSKRMFYFEYADVLGEERPLSHDDLEVLLIHLSRDKGAAAYDGQTVKFKGQTETQTPVISQEDATIASLKSLIVDLEGQITTLSEKVEKCDEQARSAVARKNRVAALAALRSKKLAEGHLTKQLAVFSQLEEVYTKIEQAADQVELVRIMEGSTGVLKSLNKEVGGIERVDDVVDKLKKEMTKVEEVGDVVAEIGREAGAVDEGEVDDELEAMEAEEKAKKEAVDRGQKGAAQEAETRRKLAELERMERDAKRGAERPEDQSLRDSIERMERLAM